MEKQLTLSRIKTICHVELLNYQTGKQLLSTLQLDEIFRTLSKFLELI